VYVKVRVVVKICEWKAVRAKGYMRFDDERAKQVTAIAFSITDPGLANWVLRSLSGVGAPMASAILTVFDQTRFTVIDVRAMRTLDVLDYGALAMERPQWLERRDRTDNSWVYGEYVALCVGIASQLRVSLRDLDRALWALNGRESIGAGISTEATNVNADTFVTRAPHGNGIPGTQD
jgi:hypothetical protein